MSSIPRLLPLFPLPNVVLFPQMPLPLHIFEPRYHAMVEDALRGDKTIGMVLLKAGWEAHYQGRPPVYPVGCAGAIEQCEPVQGKRFNILLRGLSRFRIQEEQSSKPYRLATVEPLGESATDGASLDRSHRRLLEVLGRTATVLVVQPDLPHHVFINALAQSMDLTPVEKQSLLDCDDVPSRYRRLTEILEFRQLEQSRGRSPLTH